jgi:hypothetical protein
MKPQKNTENFPVRNRAVGVRMERQCICREAVYIRIFLTSALVRIEWSASRPGRFIPEETAPGTLWIGGWVDPRADLDDTEK